MGQTVMLTEAERACAQQLPTTEPDRPQTSGR